MSDGMTRKGPKRSRMRAVLGVVLFVMVLLLGAMGYFFVKVLVPGGAPAQTRSDGRSGLQWVRSLYGFGPARDEQLLAPTSVAIAPNGTVFATDPQRGRIMAFRPDGSFLRLIHTGRGGSGKGQMLRPEGLATDRAGNLYVSDPMNQKILVFDTAGRFVREWPVPNVIGIDVQANRLLAYAGGTVVLYTLEGEKTGTIGRAGRGPGDTLMAAYGVTGDANDVYVADSHNGAIKAFANDGRLLWATTDPSSSRARESTSATEAAEPVLQLPQDLAIDGARRIVAVDAFTFKLVVLDARTGRIGSTYGDVGSGEGEFGYPTGIAYDPARDWFAVADTANDRIQIVRIPGSGGGAAQAVVRALTSPLRLCAVPLILLLIAAAILSASVRARRREELRQSLAKDGADAA